MKEVLLTIHKFTPFFSVTKRYYCDLLFGELAMQELFFSVFVYKMIDGKSLKVL
jgi:hypothetical protein